MEKYSLQIGIRLELETGGSEEALSSTLRLVAGGWGRWLWGREYTSRTSKLWMLHQLGTNLCPCNSYCPPSRGEVDD